MACRVAVLSCCAAGREEVVVVPRAVVGGVDGGFGPFDSERTLKPTEYGGGAGLVEGSPNSQTGKLGAASGGPDHLAGEGMLIDEKIGVAYRTDASGSDESGGAVDPVTGLSALDVK